MGEKSSAEYLSLTDRAERVLPDKRNKGRALIIIGIAGTATSGIIEGLFRFGMGVENMGMLLGVTSMILTLWGAQYYLSN